MMSVLGGRWWLLCLLACDRGVGKGEILNFPFNYCPNFFLISGKKPVSSRFRTALVTINWSRSTS
jgi:hypothetical protein